MEDSIVPTPGVSQEVVLVALVNKDTLEDKLKEHAAITLLTSLLTVAVTQGVPFVAKQITKFRVKRALAQKTAEETKRLTE